MNHTQKSVVFTASGIAAAIILILLYWILSRSLENVWTIANAAVLIALLAVPVYLARRGREKLAAGLLTGLLFIVVVTIAVEYGLGSPIPTAFVLPILLAAFTLGRRACLAVALFAILSVWGIGLATATGLYPPWVAYQPSDLTFRAPFYTVLLALTAGMAGSYVCFQASSESSVD